MEGRHVLWETLPVGKWMEGSVPGTTKTMPTVEGILPSEAFQQEGVQYTLKRHYPCLCPPWMEGNTVQCRNLYLCGVWEQVPDTQSW